MEPEVINALEVDLNCLGDVTIEQKIASITNTIVYAINIVCDYSKKQSLISIFIGDELLPYIKEIKQNLSIIRPTCTIIIAPPVAGNVTIKNSTTHRSINFRNI